MWAHTNPSGDLVNPRSPSHQCNEDTYIYMNSYMPVLKPSMYRLERIGMMQRKSLSNDVLHLQDSLRLDYGGWGPFCSAREISGL